MCLDMNGYFGYEYSCMGNQVWTYVDIYGWISMGIHGHLCMDKLWICMDMNEHLV